MLPGLKSHIPSVALILRSTGASIYLHLDSSTEYVNKDNFPHPHLSQLSSTLLVRKLALLLPPLLISTVIIPLSKHFSLSLTSLFLSVSLFSSLFFNSVYSEWSNEERKSREERRGGRCQKGRQREKESEGMNSCCHSSPVNGNLPWTVYP